MGDARDRQANERAAENDTALMEPSAEEPATRMTGQGNIPPVKNGFDDTGPSASDRAYGGYVRVQASTLNVRKAPTIQASIIGKLHRGQLVQEVARTGDWVQIAHDGHTGYVHHAYVTHADTRPSAESRAEVMEIFREVNGDQGRGAPPSAESRAEVMEIFREVNGDQGRGAPPSAESRAEVMQIFREVNGEPGRGAPPKLSEEERKQLLDDLE